MSGNVTTFVTWLGALGIPSIFSMTVWCIKSCRKYTKQLKVLLESQQAQMRSHLLAQYKEYVEQGWVSLEDLDDWENQYQKYHQLGANGVLDTKRNQLLSLPNNPNSVNI